MEQQPAPSARPFLSPAILLGILAFALIVGALLCLFSATALYTMRGPSATRAVAVGRAETPTPFQPILTSIPSATGAPAGIGQAAPLATAAPAQLATLPPLSSVTPTIKVWAAGERYIVQPGEDLERIAKTLGVTADQVRAANFMLGDAVLPGQGLIVPEKEGLSSWGWVYASLDKDLADSYYPLSLDAGRFRLHYMPNTYPSVDPQSVVGLVERGLAHVESVFGMPLEGGFDVYAAGTLYEPPNRYLLGRSFSLDRKVFVLHNGSGEAVYQQYLTAHELTHLYAWNTFGQPYSFLLSEGAAVYSGMRMIKDSQYLPIRAFCAAYKKEGLLPYMTPKTEMEDWRGHNNNLVNYYSAGCFVGYLLETYGVEKFGQIYHINDYPAAYGKTQDQLEAEWKAWISLDEIPAGLDTARLVSSVSRFMRANQVFYDSFSATSSSLAAYRELDKARLALLSTDFDRFDAQMQQFEAAFYR